MMKLAVYAVLLVLAAGNGQVLQGRSPTTVLKVSRGGVELEVPLYLGVIGGIATKLPWLGREINTNIIGMIGNYEDPLAASTTLQHYFKFKADYLDALRRAKVRISLTDRLKLWTLRREENFVQRISLSLRNEPALASTAAEQLNNTEELLLQQKQFLEEAEVDDINLTAQRVSELHESDAERNIAILLKEIDSLEERRAIIVKAATSAWLRKQLVDNDVSLSTTAVRPSYGTLQQEREDIEHYWQFWASLYQRQGQ